MNTVKVYDKRKVKDCIKNIESKSLIRSINTFKDKSVIIGSLEGKIAIEPIDKGEGFSFKCHRIEMDNDCVAYPVNGVEVHPLKDVFLSYGCDGFIYYWDRDKKKKIKRSSEYTGR